MPKTKKKSVLHSLDGAAIELKPIDDLKPYKNNARTHSKKQIKQIAESMDAFGMNNPVLVDGDNRIIAGHGRVLAARELGMEEIPTICISHLSDEAVRAYIIADNKIAENAGWDKQMLAIEFQCLAELDLSFDLDVTGFELPEIEIMLDTIDDDSDPEDDFDGPEEGSSITQLGDVWQMGNHLLICGDALADDTYQKLMQGKKAHAIITDPPYNVPVDGHVCGLGRIKHKEFAMASGEMSEQQFTAFLQTVCSHMAKYSTDGSLHYVFIDWRHVYELLAAGREAYAELKNICVWNKTNGGMGTLYRSKHEFVALFKHGTKPHINNIELGKHGRYRTNVWDYAGVNSFGAQQSDLEMHPTVKPVGMIADAIKDCTRRGDIVLDPFAGSGTTLIAAEKAKRAARCIEIDPHYCDVIVRRWQKLTGNEAINPATNVIFNEKEN